MNKAIEPLTFTELEQNRIFAGLSKAQYNLLWQKLKPKYQKIKKGEVVFDENDIMGIFGILKSGSLLGSKIFADGNEHLILIYLPKEIVGLDIALTKSQKCPMRIYAAANTEVWWFEIADLLQLNTSATKNIMSILQRNMLKILSNESMKKINKIGFITQKTLRYKILSYLEHFAEKSHTKSFVLPINREQLAQYLDINRSTLSHELSLMKQDGLIDFEKNSFTILY